MELSDAPGPVRSLTALSLAALAVGLPKLSSAVVASSLPAPLLAQLLPTALRTGTLSATTLLAFATSLSRLPLDSASVCNAPNGHALARALVRFRHYCIILLVARTVSFRSLVTLNSSWLCCFRIWRSCDEFTATFSSLLPPF